MRKQNLAMRVATLMAFLAGTSGLTATQTPQKGPPKPTAAIQKMLDEARKIDDSDPRVEALKKVVDSAKAAGDLEGQAEAEEALGRWIVGPTLIPWFEAAIRDFSVTGNRQAKAVSMRFLGNEYLMMGDNPKASDYYSKAYKIALEVGDRDLEGKSLENLAFVSYKTGKYEKALEFWKKSIPALKLTGSKIDLCEVLRNISIMESNLGRPESAIEASKRLFQVEKEMTDKPAMAGTLNNIGLAYSRLGQNQRALEYFNLALPIANEVGDRLFVSVVLSDIGYAYLNLGRNEVALEYYVRSLPAVKELGTKPDIGLILSTIGDIYNATGQRGKALDTYNQALEIAKTLENRHLLATLLNSIGNVHKYTGQNQEALSYYHQALSVGQELKDKGLMAYPLCNIGAVYSNLGQHQSALEYDSLALSIAKNIGDKELTGATLTNIGCIYNDLKQWQRAVNYFKKALPILQEVGDKQNVGITLSNIGNSYRGQGRIKKALSFYSQAIPVVKEADALEIMAHNLYSVSLSLSAEKETSLAVVFAKQSVNTYQDLRKNIRELPKANQDSYAKMVEPAYRGLSDLLIKQGRLREAEQVMKLLKQEENFEFVARDAAGAGGLEGRIEAIGAEAGWWNRYQVIEEKALKIDADEFSLAQKSFRLRASKTLTADQKVQLTKMEHELKELDAQKDVLDKAADAYFDEVGRLASGLAESVRKEAETRVRQTGDELPALLGRVHRQTGEKIGAVYGLASADELDFLIVTFAGRAHLSVPVKSSELNTMISGLRSQLTNPSVDPRPSGEKLYRLVFEKLIRRLRESGCTRVVWCLDGTLRHVPIGALWDGKQYLIQSSDFTMFDPLNLGRIFAESTASYEGAGFAATEGKGTEFAPLPGADKEIKAVIRDDSQAGFGGAVPGRAYENSRFDALSLTSAMKSEEFSLLHIATHFNVGKDFNSSSLLLGDGNLLSLKEFTDAGSHGRLGHLDLVCLSACDTAETFGDSTSAGSQFSSFVSLTLKDGASSVVASLWPVSDASTPLLMKRFYESWMAHKGRGKAEALRSAQLSLLNGESGELEAARRSQGASGSNPTGEKPFIKDPKHPYAHPYYWAPFILFGNWK